MDSSNVTYFIGHETLVPREDGERLPRLVQGTFAFLLRNSSEAVEYFRLPRDMVVEIGAAIRDLISIFGASSTWGELSAVPMPPGQSTLSAVSWDCFAGLGVLAFPGIGPVVAARWLASTPAAAAAGGLIGALTRPQKNPFFQSGTHAEA